MDIETLVTAFLVSPFVLMIAVMLTWALVDIKADNEAAKDQEARERRFRESGPDYGE